ARFQRLSPRKARLVTDLITGKSAEEAIAILEHLPKATALPLGRVVRSAIANAENNFNLTLENLYVKREIGRASCRERVYDSVVAVFLTKKSDLVLYT